VLEDSFTSFSDISLNLCNNFDVGGGLKTFQFGQGQGGRSFQPKEYIEYFED
jgi:hypothetical protein